MRVLEFITENWWSDLDDDVLTMMGYVVASEPPEDDPNLEIKAASNSISRSTQL